MLFLAEGFYGIPLFFSKFNSFAWMENGTSYLIRDKDKRIVSIERLFEEIEKWKGFVFGIWSYDLSETFMGISDKDRKHILSFPPLLILFLPEKGEDCSFSPRFEKIYAKNIEKPLTDSEFAQCVTTAIKRMEEGEMYVINLSRPFVIEGIKSKSWFDFFLTLKNLHPAEYSFYLQFKNWQVISNSPELFLKKRGRKLVTEPIKGTIPSGIPEGDKILRENTKERTENIMIVDLMRNNLGMVCKPGSIKVEATFEVKKLKTVYQMFSRISGILKDDENVFSIISKLMPPGSVTGAPKFQVMKNIADLERFRRNIYCGSAFLITPEKDFVMNVMIRTLVVQKEKGIYFAGAGITVESDPWRETEETTLKFKNILSLLNVNSAVCI